MNEVSIPYAARRERVAGVTSFLLAAFSLSFAIAGSVAVLEQSFMWTLPAHGMAAITGAWAGSIADRRRLGKQVFPWIMGLAIPLFGGIMAWFLLETMKKPKAGTLLDEYSTYVNDAASYRESVPILEHEIPESAVIVSLADLLSSHSSEAERRIAVEHLADMETQAAVEILRKVASSSNRESYFYAMTAMTRMEDKMYMWLQELEEAIKLKGEEKADVELLLKTSAAYFDFIYYQFAGGERRMEYLERAEILLGRVLDKASERSKECNEALILLGRVKLQMNDCEMAIQSFSRYIKQNPERPVGYLWRAEAWYMLGQYERLREDCRTVKAMENVPQKMTEILDFWLPDAPLAADKTAL